MAKTVDGYLQVHADWQHILRPLVGLIRDSQLEESVKWGAPVYTLGGRNVIGLGAFKAYAGIWFMHGALMDDPDQVLINAQEGKTRGLRQWRFGHDEVIDPQQVQVYIEHAIDNVRAGKFIKPQARAAVEIPQLLAGALTNDAGLAAAYAKLTPGRRREFAEFIGATKLQANGEKRLAKVTPMIMRGEGLNDRYRK